MTQAPVQFEQLPEETRQLVHGALAGDERAIERLLSMHYARLVGLARSVLGCEQEALDAVQDALVSAFKNISSVQDPAALRSWMDRIVVNASISALRKRKRRREYGVDDLLPQFDSTGHRLERESGWSSGLDMDSREQLAELRSCIDELPEGYREVVVLRDILGFSTAATAEVMQMEEGAVKVRLHRGRQALRTLMARRAEASR